MFVKYNPKNPHVKTIPIVFNSGGDRSIPVSSESVILRPGTNELTEEQWAAVQPHVQDDIKQKIIVPFTVEVKKAGGVMKARTLKDVPVSVARKIIESCRNAADLKKWARQELPDEVMLLVLRRLRRLKIDLDESGGDMSGEEDTLDDDITSEADTGEEDTARNDNDGDDPPKEGGGAKTGRRRGRKKTRESESEDGGHDNDGDDPQGDDGDDEIPDFDGSGGRE
ncbi:MAG: hypothetical protein LBH73_01635 [Spirochaetaceae bacterium]|jgi:hypothetical protein|nr:hypothetical protein [Spirochaetaceae bacterium]